MPNIITLIVTNNTEYLDDSIKSAQCPFVVFDGVEPVDGDFHSLRCNVGRPSIARNIGIEQIKDCDYIQLLDSDDYLKKDYFKKIYDYISQNDDFDIFYTDYTVINEDFAFKYEEHLFSMREGSNIDSLIKIKNPLIKASLFKSIKFDKDLMNLELVDFICQAGINTAFHIPLSLQFVRIHNKSLTKILNTNIQTHSLNIIRERLNGKV